MTTGLRISLLVLLSLCFSMGGRALAQEGRSVHAERLRYDARTGEWVELPRLEPGTDRGDLAAARAQMAGAEYRQAHRSIKRWLKDYGGTSELYPEAILLRGQIEKARRNYYRSQEVLTELSQDYAGTAEAEEALFEILNVSEVFLSGVRRKLWGMRILSGTDLALDLLDSITVQAPKSSLAEQAVKTKADFYFNQGDFALSEFEYSRLIQMFPKSRYVRYAMRRSADAALASFAGTQFDDAPLIEAQERYRQYAQQYRGLADQDQVGLILADINEKRGLKEFEIGEYYERTDHPKAAAFYYRSTMSNWPDTIAADKAAVALGRAVGDSTEKEAASALTGTETAASSQDREAD